MFLSFRLETNQKGAPSKRDTPERHSKRIGYQSQGRRTVPRRWSRPLGTQSTASLTVNVLAGPKGKARGSNFHLLSGTKEVCTISALSALIVGSSTTTTESKLGNGTNHLGETDRAGENKPIGKPPCSPVRLNKSPGVAAQIV